MKTKTNKGTSNVKENVDEFEVQDENDRRA